MQPLVTRLCQVGRWSAYLMVRRQPRKTSRNKSHSYRDTKRSSSSSTTMKQGVRPLNLPREYSHRGVLRLLDSKITKMLQTLSKLEMLIASGKPSGTQSPYRPDGIIDGKNLLNIVTEPTKACDHKYPYQGMNDMLHGIRYGELINHHCRYR